MGLVEGRQLEESILYDIRWMARFEAHSKVRVAPKCAVQVFLLTLACYASVRNTAQRFTHVAY